MPTPVLPSSEIPKAKLPKSPPGKSPSEKKFAASFGAAATAQHAESTTYETAREDRLMDGWLPRCCPHVQPRMRLGCTTAAVKYFVHRLLRRTPRCRNAAT